MFNNTTIERANVLQDIGIFSLPLERNNTYVDPLLVEDTFRSQDVDIQDFIISTFGKFAGTVSLTQMLLIERSLERDREERDIIRFNGQSD